MLPRVPTKLLPHFQRQHRYPPTHTTQLCSFGTTSVDSLLWWPLLWTPDVTGQGAGALKDADSALEAASAPQGRAPPINDPALATITADSALPPRGVAAPALGGETPPGTANGCGCLRIAAQPSLFRH